MGILAKLFGYCGKIRFEGITEDNRRFTGTIEIESFNYSNQELEEKLKNIVYVEEGIRVKELKIVALT